MVLSDDDDTCPACGRRISAYQAAGHQLQPGNLLELRYRVGGVLGQGGFGITYIGLDERLGRRVAIKEYFPTTFVKREVSISTAVTCYSDSSQSFFEKGREQFLSEAKTIAKFDDIQEIVQVLDFFPENDTAYIVMEYLEGEPLAKLLERDGAFQIGALLDLFAPLIQALGAMHKTGIIHRDINPNNIMVMKNGRLKLMDFGCARNVDGNRTMTVILTHGYAPVEQYFGHDQGPWSDIYSLCATIYACLTGKKPPQSLMREKNSDPLEPPSKLGIDIDPELEKALMKGLNINAKERWQSATELYDALCGTVVFPCRKNNSDKLDLLVQEKNETGRKKNRVRETDDSAKFRFTLKKTKAGETEILNDPVINGKSDRTSIRWKLIAACAGVVCIIALAVLGIAKTAQYNNKTNAENLPPSVPAEAVTAPATTEDEQRILWDQLENLPLMSEN